MRAIVTSHAVDRWVQRFGGCDDMAEAVSRAAPDGRTHDGRRRFKDADTGAVFVVCRRGHKKRLVVLTVIREK